MRIFSETFLKFKIANDTEGASKLLQCVLEISVNFKGLPTSRDLPSKIVQPLILLSTTARPGMVTNNGYSVKINNKNQ